MTTRSRSVAVLPRHVLTALGACCALAWAGCSSTPGDSMLARFNTVPNGASVTIERLNLTMSTPCDLDFNLIDVDDVLIVRKEGYRTVQTTLEEVPQVAVGSYELRMEKQ